MKEICITINFAHPEKIPGAISHGPANISQQVLLKPQKRKHKTIKCVIPAIFIRSLFNYYKL